jgi:hypothetical protein
VREGEREREGSEPRWREEREGGALIKFRKIIKKLCINYSLSYAILHMLEKP